MTVALTLPDDAVIKLDGPVPVPEAIKAISEGLLRRAVAVKLNGKLVDLHSTLDASRCSPSRTRTPSRCCATAPRT